MTVLTTRQSAARSRMFELPADDGQLIDEVAWNSSGVGARQRRGASTVAVGVDTFRRACSIQQSWDPITPTLPTLS
jgi:hypothetical protein